MISLSLSLSLSWCFFEEEAEEVLPSGHSGRRKRRRRRRWWMRRRRRRRAVRPLLRTRACVLERDCACIFAYWCACARWTQIGLPRMDYPRARGARCSGEQVRSRPYLLKRVCETDNRSCGWSGFGRRICDVYWFTCNGRSARTIPVLNRRAGLIFFRLLG